jgi:hypothetical protein
MGGLDDTLRMSAPGRVASTTLATHFSRSSKPTFALQIVCAIAVSAGLACPGAEEGSPARLQVTAQCSPRRVIYHSPQTPGYTCWAGIWKMPDASLMVGFTQATGPLEGWRPRAPAAVLRRMPKATREIAGYDMTGLTQENVHLRSTDGGKSWVKASSDPFSSCMNGMWGGGILALQGGTLLRDAWGQGLPCWDVRQTGFLQRSSDGAKTWGAPEYLSGDPHLQAWPKRLRRLRDGRLLLTGAFSPYEEDKWSWDAQLPKLRPCLWVSDGPDGKSWTGPLAIAPEGVRYAGEEWDAAELDSGDLLAVLRTATYDAAGSTSSQERRQAILAKRGPTWEPGPISAAPFPHSGQPELLAAREGVILHIASDGIWWTADRGATWTRLDMPGTAYYPCALQLDDGEILVVSHVGSDDPYGKVDQSIVLDSFRLSVNRKGR